MTNEENCGQYSIKDLKPALPATQYDCKGCPLADKPKECYDMMVHSDNHCQKYLKACQFDEHLYLMHLTHEPVPMEHVQEILGMTPTEMEKMIREASKDAPRGPPGAAA